MFLSDGLPPSKADETQANLAFVALRQEPFLVEEFDYLANQIRDLHEVRRGGKNDEYIVGPLGVVNLFRKIPTSGG